MWDSQKWNFALYNGLGVAALIVFILYGLFIYSKIKKREFDWSFHFAIGIMIATFSRLLERIYYGALRAFQFTDKQTGELISPAWIISVIATIGIIGLLWHTKTLSKHSFDTRLYKGAVWITLGTVISSFVWALLS